MFQLEKASKKFTCPNCGALKKFKRYVNLTTGEYLADYVGRCDRESSCAYHFTPKDFFIDNPQDLKPSSKTLPPARAESTQPSDFDFIPAKHLQATLGDYDHNGFVIFLLNLFSDCREDVQEVLKKYFVGTYETYTCFPRIDRQRRVCSAKLIRYNFETGKRLKGDFDASSLPKKLRLKEKFNYKPCFFGEHLLAEASDKPVAIVEAEKTALIASICFPEFTWLASFNKSWLKPHQLQRIGNRKIILYPDADGFDSWQEVALDARNLGMQIKVSSLIEKHATREQKQSGYDLADFLISEQMWINEHNWRADDYNSKLELILQNENLFDRFNLALDAQKTNLILKGGYSESEAETKISDLENVRQTVFNIAERQFSQ